MYAQSNFPHILETFIEQDEEIHLVTAAIAGKSVIQVIINRVCMQRVLL